MSKKTLTAKSSDIKCRVTWGFNPVSRVKSSKKAYSRKNYKIPSH
jgi:hypothetical protein